MVLSVRRFCHSAEISLCIYYYQKRFLLNDKSDVVKAVR